jgi:hypothetical protein
VLTFFAAQALAGFLRIRSPTDVLRDLLQLRD